MGFSESDSTKCRRHPNPKQLPGVCPTCLRERLTKLSTTTTTTTSSSKATTSSALSNSSSLSSASASTTTVSHHRRNGSEVPSYVSVGMVLNSTGLKKSRSVSCAALSCKSIRDANKNIITNNKNCIMKNDYNKNEEGDHEEKEGECKMRKKIGGGGFLKKLIHKKTKGV